jgi:hypothetical protein
MRRYRSNADKGLRRAERRSLDGGTYDEARLIVENLRSGRLTADRVILAAAVNPAARMVVREMNLQPSRRLWNTYISAAYSDPADFMDEVLDPEWTPLLGTDGLGALLLTISRKISTRRRMLACIMAACFKPFEKAYKRELRRDDANLLKWSLRVLDRACSGKRSRPKRELVALVEALERSHREIREREDVCGDWDRGERLARTRRLTVLLLDYFDQIANRRPYSDHVLEVSHALDALGSMGIYIRPKARVGETWRDLVVAWCLDPEIQ